MDAVFGSVEPVHNAKKWYQQAGCRLDAVKREEEDNKYFLGCVDHFPRSQNP
jgi:hypothetical protein